MRPAKSFGVEADARILTGVGVTGITLTGTGFTSDDVGRNVCAYTIAGKVGQAVVTARTSSTQLTLGTALTTTTGALEVVGTDDTQAWQDAID